METITTELRIRRAMMTMPYGGDPYIASGQPFEFENTTLEDIARYLEKLSEYLQWTTNK